MPTATATREEVVRAARALLVEDGPEAVTMRRLAAELGTSYQVVYSRVGAKPEVLRAVHDAAFRELAARVAARPGTRGSTEQLHDLTVGYLEFAVAGPRLFDLMFGPPAAGLERDDAMRAVEQDAFRECWVLPARAWLDREHPQRPPRSALRLAWRLWSAVHGITVLHLAGHRTPSGDVRGEVVGVVDLVLGDPLRP